MESNAPAFINRANFRQGLFGSQAWNNAWRQTWGQSQALRISPETRFYTQAIKLKGYIPIIQAVPIGHSTQGLPSIRSEYTFFAQHPDHSATQIEQFFTQAKTQPWHQLWLSDLPTDATEYPIILKTAKEHELWIHSVEINTAYGVDTRQNRWEDYLHQLGKNTRLQVYNRRKNLEKLGTVEIKNYWPQWQDFLVIMDGFHQKRWGKPLYTGKNKEFMEILLPELAASGHSIDLSVLSLNNTPLAAIIDIHINGHVYNLQSGFNEEFDNKISLGSLHFGYKIEQAFNNPAIEYYDFMAGKGRSANYKKQLATHSLDFATLCCIRSRWLHYLQKTYQWLQRHKPKKPS